MRIEDKLGRFLLVSAIVAVAVGSWSCQYIRGQRAPVPDVPRFYLEAGGSRGAMPRPTPTDTVILPVSRTQISIDLQPVFAEHNIDRVGLYRVERGLVLGFALSPSGSRELARLTVQNIGRRLVLVIDGQAMGARPIEGIIEGGMIYTFVEVDDIYLEEMVEDLNEALRLAKRRLK